MILNFLVTTGSTLKHGWNNEITDVNTIFSALKKKKKKATECFQAQIRI